MFSLSACGESRVHPGETAELQTKESDENMTQEPYPADFDELKDVNHEEMNTGFLPLLMESNLDMEQYDSVLYS